MMSKKIRFSFIVTILVSALMLICVSGTATGQEKQGSEKQTTPPKVVRATDEQADSIRACILASNRASADARMMLGITKEKLFETYIANVLERFNHQLNIVRTEHQKLTESLSEDQRERISHEIESIDGINEAVDSQLEQMNKEVNSSAPNRDSVAQNTRELDKLMHECQQRYKSIAALMRVKLERK